MDEVIAVERRQIVDDVILWLSLLSVAAVCLLMLYMGIAGLARLPDSQAPPMKQVFAVSVYILFILLPLLILNLVLDTTFIHGFFEWSVTLLYIAIVADILLMTVFFLLMGS